MIERPNTYFARRPTIKKALGSPPPPSAKSLCPPKFSYTRCGLCLPTQFRNITYAPPIKGPRIAVFCGCFNGRAGTFFTGAGRCVPNEAFEFRTIGELCPHPQLPEILPSQTKREEDDISRHLFPFAVGMLGFMFLFFIIKGMRGK